MKGIKVMLISAIVLMYGCSPTASNGTCPVKNTFQKIFHGKTFTDPFAYCGSIGTIDEPDKRYTGEKIPASMQARIRKTMNLPDDVPDDYITLTTCWRCMDGKVFICMTGANLPCLEKADTRREPSAAMNDYCRENPGSQYIPAYVTGRSTVYDWKCSETKPAIEKQVSFPDKRGFLSDIWHQIKAD